MVGTHEKMKWIAMGEKVDKFTLVLEYMVIRGVGRTAEAEEMFRMRPFFRWTIFSRTKRHIRVTDTTLQLINEWANSLLFGTWNNINYQSRIFQGFCFVSLQFNRGQNSGKKIENRF